MESSKRRREAESYDAATLFSPTAKRILNGIKEELQNQELPDANFAFLKTDALTVQGIKGIPLLVTIPVAADLEQIIRYGKDGMPLERALYNKSGFRQGPMQLFEPGNGRMIFTAMYEHNKLHGSVQMEKTAKYTFENELPLFNLGAVITSFISEASTAKLSGTWRIGYPCGTVSIFAKVKSRNTQLVCTFSEKDCELVTLALFEEDSSPTKLTRTLCSSVQDSMLNGNADFRSLKHLTIQQLSKIGVPPMFAQQFDKSVSVPCKGYFRNGHLTNLVAENKYELGWADSDLPELGLQDSLRNVYYKRKASVIDLLDIRYKVMTLHVSEGSQESLIATRAYIVQDEQGNGSAELYDTLGCIAKATFTSKGWKEMTVFFSGYTIQLDEHLNVVTMEGHSLSIAYEQHMNRVKVTCPYWGDDTFLTFYAESNENFQVCSVYPDAIALPFLLDDMRCELWSGSTMRARGTLDSMEPPQGSDILENYHPQAQLGWSIEIFGTFFLEHSIVYSTAILSDNLKNMHFTSSYLNIGLQFSKKINGGEFIMQQKLTTGDQFFIPPQYTILTLPLHPSQNRLFGEDKSECYKFAKFLAHNRWELSIPNDVRKQLHWVDFVTRDPISQSSKSTVFVLNFSYDKLKDAAESGTLATLNPLILTFTSFVEYLENSGVSPTNGSEPLLHFTPLAFV